MKEKVAIEYVASFNDVTGMVDSYTAALPITEVRVHPAPHPGAPGMYLEFHWREADGRNQSEILNRFVEMAEQHCDTNHIRLENGLIDYEGVLSDWETFRDGVQLMSLLGHIDKPSDGLMDKVLNRIDEMRLTIEDRDHDLNIKAKKE